MNTDNNSSVEKTEQKNVTKPAKRFWKIFLPIVCFLTVFCVLFLFLQALLVPKYMSFPYEGGMVREYYESGKNHSVVFIGDCEFYETINPVVLWNEYGINSYVRGSSQQLIWDSYYYLLETLEYEKPEVVVFNAVEMKIDSVQNEAYTRLTLDGLRLSKYKIAAAKQSLTEGESLASYIFPILRYHSRWSELTSDDFKYLFKRDPITLNGYLFMSGTEPKTSTVSKPPVKNVRFSDICWEYLNKIKDVCAENGIELIIFKAPTDTWHYPWYEVWDEQLVEYAAQNEGVRYISAITENDEIGIDWTTDSYDGGDHTNYIGAEKVSKYLGKILSAEYGVKDERDSEALTAYWDKINSRYLEAVSASEK